MIKYFNEILTLVLYMLNIYLIIIFKHLIERNLDSSRNAFHFGHHIPINRYEALYQYTTSKSVDI